MHSWISHVLKPSKSRRGDAPRENFMKYTGGGRIFLPYFSGKDLIFMSLLRQRNRCGVPLWCLPDDGARDTWHNPGRFKFLLREYLLWLQLPGWGVSGLMAQPAPVKFRRNWTLVPYRDVTTMKIAPCFSAGVSIYRQRFRPGMVILTENEALCRPALGKYLRPLCKSHAGTRYHSYNPAVHRPIGQMLPESMGKTGTMNAITGGYTNVRKKYP